MIDVHCHLEDEAFDEDLDEVIKRAMDRGVKAIVTSAIYPEDVDKALSIVRRYEGYVYLSIGLDPTVLEQEAYRAQREALLKYRDLVVAVGEVGLDYYYVRDHDDRRRQEELFRKWIRLARDLGKPLVVHSRSAGKYAIQVLLNEGYTNVIMHAYDGGAGWAAKAAEEGMYFSIPPSVWHSRQKQKLVKALPLESLLLESDAPVLSPFKGVRNEPANIVYSVKKIAEIKRVSESRVVEVTSENAVNLLRLDLERR